MSARILVVDDEPDMRLLLALALRGPDFDISEAATGEQALAAEATGAFDLVLLDLNLPGISGMEVLATWTASRVVPKLPVLVVTADVRPGLDRLVADRGAAGFLTKPIRPAALVTAVRDALSPRGAPPATVEGA